MSTLEQTVNDIKKMKVRGALDIAIASVAALKQVAQEDSKSSAELAKKIRDAGRKLKNSRPTAVSLPNAVDYIVYVSEKNRQKPPAEYREKVTEAAEKFINDQEKALEKIGTIGAKIIAKDETILTHCNSDTVVQILKKAYDQGKNLKVVCTESRPRYQGLLTAKELSEYGIPTTIIVDSAVHLAMKKLRIDKVIVGADTICANGDLVNKIGTSQIALCAHEQDIEFIVATESIKFSPQSLLGSAIEIEERSGSEVIKPGRLRKVKVFNPAFDVTEAEYINMIVTEYGIMPPQAAYNLLKEKFGWELK